jgi:hypothetical protein
MSSIGDMGLPVFAGVLMTTIAYRSLFWMILVCFTLTVGIYGAVMWLTKKKSTTSDKVEFEILNEAT